ncbi:MAG: permease-like cell division protein FtsX [Rikenellaceae bacterium]|nr:permease-like cell division protein FtsX [Rikenellaceae bacterium]
MATSEKKIKRRVRSAYVISTVSIALVLFLLGSVGYLTLNAREASDQLKENMTVSVWLRDGLEELEVTALQGRLQGLSGVKSVSYTSKEQAARDFTAFSGMDFESFLDDNPLPASFEVTLLAEYSEPDSVRWFHRTLAEWNEVDDVLYQEAIIEQIAENIRKFNLVLLFFGGTLLLISLILIRNTIRMAIFSKRSIINTMKLVGATRGFILKPFLWRAVGQGILAAWIALCLIASVIYGLREGLPEAGFFADLLRLGILAGAVTAAGIVISFLFTYSAVNKYIKLNTQKMHIY